MIIQKKQLLAQLLKYLFIYLFTGLLIYYFWRTDDWKLILLRPLAATAVYLVYDWIHHQKTNHKKVEKGEAESG